MQKGNFVEVECVGRHQLFIAEVLAVKMPDHFQHCVHAPLLLNYAHQISQADPLHANQPAANRKPKLDESSQGSSQRLMISPLKEIYPIYIIHVCNSSPLKFHRRGWPPAFCTTKRFFSIEWDAFSRYEDLFSTKSMASM